MTSYVAIVVDPRDHAVQSIPVLSESPNHVIQHVQHKHPRLQAQVVLDKDALLRWRNELDELRQSFNGPNPRRFGFVAMIRKPIGPGLFTGLAIPMEAPSMNAAVDFLHARHPDWVIEGLIARTLLDRWVHDLETLEQDQLHPA